MGKVPNDVDSGAGIQPRWSQFRGDRVRGVCRGPHSHSLYALILTAKVT